MDSITISNEPVTMTGWDKASFALENKLGRVLLYGPPGTGKTYFGMNYFLGSGQLAYRLICTEEMTDADLIGGQKMGNDGIWRFREGVGIKAWRHGARLVVDEINRVNSDVESRLMALIDTSTSSSWENPDTGEIVKPHPDFSVVATMNGDPEDLGAAIRDRLVVRVEIDTPHEDGITALPEYLRDLARSVTSRQGDDRYSLRSFVEFAGLYERSKDAHRSALVTMPDLVDSIVDGIAIRSTVG